MPEFQILDRVDGYYLIWGTGDKAEVHFLANDKKELLPSLPGIDTDAAEYSLSVMIRAMGRELSTDDIIELGMQQHTN